MAGESIFIYGTTVNVVTSGASLTSTSFSGAPASAVTGSHVLGDVVFEGTFAVAPDAEKVLYLYRRDLNIKGTTDSQIPSSSNKNTYIGTINLANTTTQACQISAIPLSPDCEFYIENASGQTLNAGWTLDVKPFGYGIAA